MNRLNIYGKKRIRLPIPKLVVFYNGTEGKEDTILKLSDAFDMSGGGRSAEPDIEVRVRMIDINYGKNQKMMEAAVHWLSMPG